VEIQISRQKANEFSGSCGLFSTHLLQTSDVTEMEDELLRFCEIKEQGPP